MDKQLSYTAFSGPGSIMERQTSSTQVNAIGMGPRKASLYLSRTASILKPQNLESLGQVSEPDNSEENGKQSRASKVSQNSRKISKTSVCSNKDEFMPPLQKEFTFTGYDIMADAEPSPKFDDDEVERTRRDNVQYYTSACRQAGLIPVSYVIKHLNDDKFTMKSHPLGPEGTRSLCIALVNNKFIEKLDLEDNDIGPEGCSCIVEMLKKNDTIKHVNISENSIGPRGILEFSQLLKDGKFLHTLDISGSKLNDGDAKYVGNIIEFNQHLRILILHHNRLGDDGGFDVGRAIAINETLKELDLSWNQIRGKGALALAIGIQRNIGLHKLNVSWNGLAKSGSEGFGAALAENRTLIELNIASNRLGVKQVGNIMKGLQENDTLETLRMGQNPYSPEVAFTILHTIQESDKCVLKVLDLTDIAVRSDFLKKWDEIKTKRQIPLRIVFGAIVKSLEAPQKDPNAIDWQDPITRMFKFMQDKGYRVLDLLKRLDKDRSLSVDRDEFKRGLMAENVPLTEAQLDEIITQLDKDGDGEVDFGELIAGEKDFRRKMHIRLRKMTQQRNTATNTTLNSVISKLKEIEEL